MNLYEILQNPDRVGEGMTHFERLFAQKVGGGKINEIFGVPPLRYIGDGRPLTDYLISGNTVQDGTPSADAPVDAVGCGVRTGNLAPPLSEWEDGYITGGADGGFLHAPTSAKEKVSNFIEVSPNTTYDFSFETGNFIGGTNAWRAIAEYNERKEYITRLGGGGDGQITLTTLSSAKYLRLMHRTYGSSLNTMLNPGSTALPYEPYGFKLPLTVNDTEYPIYLGTVPTTRRIKKLVLTGNESVSKDTGQDSTLYFLRYRHIQINGYCTHLRGVSSKPQSGEFSTVAQYDGYIFMNFGADIMNAQQSGNTVEGFKEYLAAQYAAGTPVTVWYVLAEPETGIVNEPLMKIGDYADTISFAQAGVTIPTVSGENVLDVPTEVKPSEVWIRGRIKEV